MPSPAAKRESARSSGTKTHSGPRKQVNSQDEEDDRSDSVSEPTSSQRHDGAEQENSQHYVASDDDLARLMLDMMKANYQRHDMTKSSIHQNYSQSTSDTRDAINRLFDEHEKESSQVHEAQLERLRSLLKRKGDIEAQMEQKLTTLRKEYCTHALDLQRAVEERARQLK